MVISVPGELITLAKIFKKNNETLYLVGGYIRNKILGIADEYNLDIDVASSAKPDKIVKMLEGTEFSCSYMNKELGVLEIKNTLRVEHATFRREIYEAKGAHIPNNVEFIKSLDEDAKRRDFKCNAIYYDILEEEIIDPLDGFKDINNKLISTTLDAEVVFEDDGERILRMVRFAAQFGFEIEKTTYAAAKRNVAKLRLISKTRIREEFSRIVLADTKYPLLTGTKYAHARGVMMLKDIGALKYILPSLDEISKTAIYEDRGKLLFEHVMNVFALSSPEVRLSALLHDAGKAKSLMQFGNFNGSEDFTPVIIENELGVMGLGYSKKIVERVKKVVIAQDFNKYGLESAKNIRHFIRDNHEVIDLILALKKATTLERTSKTTLSYNYLRIKKIYDKMLMQNTPFELSDLNINGDDILQTFPQIRENRIGKLLDKLLDKCVDKPTLNAKEKLLNKAEKIILRDKDEYLEV